MKAKIVCYLMVLIVLAIIAHPDILTNLVDRFTNLPKATAYGMGIFHPFIFSFFVWLIIFSIKKVLIKIFYFTKKGKQ